MRQWIGGESEVWPDEKWEIYAIPGATSAVADLAARHRGVIEEFPEHLSVVDRQWLHMTVHPVPWWATETAESEVRRLHTALCDAAAALDPVTITIGPGLASRVGPLLETDTADDGPWAEVTSRIAAAVEEITGTPATTTSPAHVSLAYTTADLDVAGHERLASRLRRVRTHPVRAQWTVDTLHLARVRQDPVAHTYTWAQAHPIPIGARR